MAQAVWLEDSKFKRVLTNLKEFKKSKAKAARLCGVGEEKNYNEHLKI